MSDWQTRVPVGWRRAEWWHPRHCSPIALLNTGSAAAYAAMVSGVVGFALTARSLAAGLSLLVASAISAGVWLWAEQAWRTE